MAIYLKIIGINMIVNIAIFDKKMFIGIILIMNNIGPRTEPSGTPSMLK